MDNRIRTALIAVITLVWAVNFIAPVFRIGYKPPAEINLAFMGVVGILTATYQKKDNGKDNTKKNGESDAGS